MPKVIVRHTMCFHIVPIASSHNMVWKSHGRPSFSFGTFFAQMKRTFLITAFQRGC